MGDDDLKNDSQLNDSQEIEIDPEATAELESAIQEAAAAVDRVKEMAGEQLAEADSAVANATQDGLAETEEVGVTALHEEIAELRDRSTRALADFDNYRKRVDREREEERRFAAFEMIQEFLPVIDNLERALASDGPADDLKAGVELILRQMHDLLRSQSVRRVLAEGEEFDPKVHDAVSRHEDSEVEVPTVSEELQSGYLMHDRLLRSSIVKVAMPVDKESIDDSDSEGPVH